MKTRVISAVIAVILLAGIYWFLDKQGLYVITSLVAMGCCYEYSRLTLRKVGAPLHIQITFFLLAALLFFSLAWLENLGLAVAALSSVFFLTMVIFTIRSTEDLASALQTQSFALLGFLYCGIFPSLAVRLLHLNEGVVWLFGLLGVVFAGDTFAYFFGRAFGRNKLLEPVSPKKTIEGSIGGLLGSALAGGVLGYFFLTDYNLVFLVLVGLVTGGFAQVGDLFESLIKRVADVKDSGKIMPGHGGILDRVDGVLFAAPVYYVLARFLSN